MIVVKVELWSAVTGIKTELARMTISNVGGTNTQRNYEAVTLRGRSTEALDKFKPQRTGKVFNHRSLDLHVWHLVQKALSAMGYGQ